MFILTSLSPQPGAEARQREALASWLEAGYRGISLNFPWEVEDMAARFAGLVEVVPVHQACRGSPHRKLVAVADLLEASFERNHGQAAMVLNADILLERDAKDFLQASEESVLMVPRWEIEASSQRAGRKLNPWGYDGALLGRRLRGAFHSRVFGLGIPWWDYWLPFRAIHLGWGVSVLREPKALHVRHAEHWDEEDRKRMAGEVWREVGVTPWKRFWRRHWGPKANRKNYRHHNHLAGHVRSEIRRISGYDPAGTGTPRFLSQSKT